MYCTRQCGLVQNLQLSLKESDFVFFTLLSESYKKVKFSRNHLIYMCRKAMKSERGYTYHLRVNLQEAWSTWNNHPTLRYKSPLQLYKKVGKEPGGWSQLVHTLDRLAFRLSSFPGPCQWVKSNPGDGAECFFPLPHLESTTMLSSLAHKQQ